MQKKILFFSHRRESYDRLLEAVQSREWEVASTPVRHKRFIIQENANATFDTAYLPQAVLSSALVAMYIFLATYDNGTYIGQAPYDQPQPGSYGGGGLPLGRRDPIGNHLLYVTILSCLTFSCLFSVQEAAALVPDDLVPVSVFPPYADRKLSGNYRATAVIFEEKPNCKKDVYLSRRRRQATWYDWWELFTTRVGSTVDRINRYEMVLKLV